MLLALAAAGFLPRRPLVFNCVCPNESSNDSNSDHYIPFDEWKRQKDTPKNIKVVKKSVVPQKDQFNYASTDCAATVVKTSPNTKGASALLTEVKDSYLVHKCANPEKFVVIELCQDILVSSIVMGNYELFSSSFEKVRFSVSERYPGEWRVLGEVTARNIRDLQVFPIEKPLIWARYLKIEILLHFGNEFYCPISLVRVHGTTMMEEIKQPQEEEEECKVTPYLALNDFLRVFNKTDNYCEADSLPAQESILKNIVNRLTLLESNASLSLLYVQEQNKLLSDAFASMEKRYTAKANALFSKLTATTEKMKRQHQATMLALVADLQAKNVQLASELAFQKVVVAVNSILLLTLLAYVVTRESDLDERGKAQAMTVRKLRGKRDDGL